jgi:AraC-like DNA-binding protein
MNGTLNSLELLIRGIAVGGFLSLGIGLGRGPAMPARMTGLLCSIGAVAHVIAQSPAALSSLGVFSILAIALSLMAVGLLWLFAIELFGDHHRLDPRLFTPAGLLLAIGVAAFVAPPSVSRILWIGHSLIGAGFLAHALVVIATGWRQDLVESRRLLRGPVLAVGAAYALALMGVEITSLVRGAEPAGSLVLAIFLMLLSMAGACAFLQADPSLFESTPPTAKSVPPAHGPKILAALSQLANAMDVQELWRREALTIGELSEVVGVPEYALRRLINGELGYRNFPEFLNERRVAAAKVALRATKARVSSIAYDVGFSSLGPFNRAFKEATGVTPIKWRSGA